MPGEGFIAKGRSTMTVLRDRVITGVCEATTEADSGRLLTPGPTNG